MILSRSYDIREVLNSTCFHSNENKVFLIYQLSKYLILQTYKILTFILNMNRKIRLNKLLNFRGIKLIKMKTFYLYNYFIFYKIEW